MVVQNMIDDSRMEMYAAGQMVCTEVKPLCMVVHVKGGPLLWQYRYNSAGLIQLCSRDSISWHTPQWHDDQILGSQSV